MGILSFVLENKTMVIIAFLSIIIFGQGVYISSLRSDISKITSENTLLNVKLTESQANLVQLQNNIVDQNNAIDAMKREADARVKKHADDIKKSKVIADNYKKQAEDLLTRVMPQELNQCDAANLLINGELK